MRSQAQRLENAMLNEIQRTIDTYNMFARGEDVFVAFSGGKDSLATLVLLSELGYATRALFVDVGDPLFDAVEVMKVAERVGSRVQVIRAWNGHTEELLSDMEQADVVSRLRILQSMPKDSTSSCTHCYAVKMQLLYGFVRSRGGTAVVLGQHRDDMIDSLLKCYWTDIYYWQVTQPKGIPYSAGVMRAVMRDHCEIDLGHLRSLVDRQLAATDDPFVEKSGKFGGMKTVRPLGATAERDVVEYLNLKALEPAGDFCSFKKNWSASERAFRLVVHDDYQTRLRQQPNLEKEIFELVLMGLMKDGTWRFRPRNSRDKHYPGFKPFIRKP